MKRLFGILICSALLFVFSGCSFYSHTMKDGDKYLITGTTTILFFQGGFVKECTKDFEGKLTDCINIK